METGYSRSLGPTVAPVIAPLAALNLGSLFGSTFGKGGYIYLALVKYKVICSN